MKIPTTPKSLTKKQINIRLTAKHLARLDKLAKHYDVTRTAMLRMLINDKHAALGFIDGIGGPHISREAPEVKLTAGAAVRRARELARMSQQELALETGISCSKIARIENGALELSVEHAEAIVKVLGPAFA